MMWGSPLVLLQFPSNVSPTLRPKCAPNSKILASGRTCIGKMWTAHATWRLVLWLLSSWNPQAIPYFYHISILCIPIHWDLVKIRSALYHSYSMLSPCNMSPFSDTAVWKSSGDPCWNPLRSGSHPTRGSGLVGVGVGTYWALLDLCEARKNRLFEWLDICNLMSQNCLTNPNQL